MSENDNNLSCSWENNTLKLKGVIPLAKNFHDCLQEIDFFNDSDITLDLSEIEFENGELQKVTVNWGDDITESFFKKITLKDDDIEQESWKVITHNFQAKNKNLFDEENSELFPKIKIILYSSLGQVVRVICCSYKINFKELSALDVRFTLKSANTNNEGFTSFVFDTFFNNGSTNGGMIVVQERDFSKVYDDEIIKYNDESDESQIDYLISDDVEWDWNLAPEIQLTTTFTPQDFNDTSNYFDCSFKSLSISLDKWEAKVYRLIDGKEVECKVEQDEYDYRFTFTDATNDIEGGIYKIVVDYWGINGKKGETIKYQTAPTDYSPADSFDCSFKIFENHYNEINFEKNNSYFDKSHIQSFDLEIKPLAVDTSDDGMGDNYTNITVSKSFKNRLTNDNVLLPLKDFPNGRYEINYIATDVLGKRKYGSITDSNQTDFTWYYENVYHIENLNYNENNYDISFEIDKNISDKGLINDVEIQIEGEDVENDWFIYSLRNVHDSFIENENDGVLKCKSKLPTDIMPNGNYSYSISNILYITNTIGNSSTYRKTSETGSFNYSSPAANNIVVNFLPVVKYGNDESGKYGINLYLNFTIDSGALELSDPEAQRDDKNIIIEDNLVLIDKENITSEQKYILQASNEDFNITWRKRVSAKVDSDIDTFLQKKVWNYDNFVFDESVEPVDIKKLDIIDDNVDYIKLTNEGEIPLSGEEVKKESFATIKFIEKDTDNNIYKIDNTDFKVTCDSTEYKLYFVGIEYIHSQTGETFKRYIPKFISDSSFNFKTDDINLNETVVLDSDDATIATTLQIYDFDKDEIVNGIIIEPEYKYNEYVYDDSQDIEVKQEIKVEEVREQIYNSDTDTSSIRIDFYNGNDYEYGILKLKSKSNDSLVYYYDFINNLMKSTNNHSFDMTELDIKETEESVTEDGLKEVALVSKDEHLTKCLITNVPIDTYDIDCVLSQFGFNNLKITKEGGIQVKGNWNQVIDITYALKFDKQNPEDTSYEVSLDFYWSLGKALENINASNVIFKYKFSNSSSTPTDWNAIEKLNCPIYIPSTTDDGDLNSNATYYTFSGTKNIGTVNENEEGEMDLSNILITDAMKYFHYYFEIEKDYEEDNGKVKNYIDDPKTIDLTVYNYEVDENGEEVLIIPEKQIYRFPDKNQNINITNIAQSYNVSEGE